MNQKVRVATVSLVALIVGIGSMLGVMMFQDGIEIGITTTTTTTSTTTTTTTSTTTTTTTITEPLIEIPDSLHYNGVDVWWLVVGGVKIKSGDLVIYIDPFEIHDLETPFLEPADYIIVTHDHSPHCSPADVNALRDSNTTVITSQIASYRIIETYITAPGSTMNFTEVSFEFVPSYNVNKFRENGQLFHPPDNGNLGVIVDIAGVRIYHAGDSDRIPEMTSIDTDVALLPVSGYAWMEPDEAAGAVDDLKVSSDLAYAVPIHWGHNQGTRWHAERFAELANCTVVILDRLVL